jgi:hypothetical protein
LVGKFGWKRENQRDVDLDGKVILKMGLREIGQGFVWLRVETSGGTL